MPLDNLPTQQLVTAKDRLLYLASHFGQQTGTKFKSMRGVEFQTVAKLRKIRVAGTIFEPIASALTEAGVAVGGNSTEITAGDVMGVLSLDQVATNRCLCHCINGDEITGEQLGKNFAAAAAKSA